MGVKILGMKQVQKNLDKVGKSLSEAKTKGLIEVGETGVSIIKRNTPVKDGRLRGSMTYTIANKQDGLESPASRSDTLDKNPKKDVVILGTNVIYARRVEFFSKTGSAGFFLRSFNQIKKVVKPILEKHYKRALK